MGSTYSTNGSVAGIFTKAGVGVMIPDNQGRILLERRSDNGRWGVPGGKIDPGETIEQAAVREAFEETGLKVAVVRMIGVYSDPADGRIVTYDDNGDVAQLIDVAVEARIESGELRISEESLELRFFGPDEIPDDLVPPAVVPVRDFFESKSNVLR